MWHISWWYPTLLSAHVALNSKVGGTYIFYCTIVNLQWWLIAVLFCSNHSMVKMSPLERNSPKWYDGLFSKVVWWFILLRLFSIMHYILSFPHAHNRCWSGTRERRFQRWNRRRSSSDKEDPPTHTLRPDQAITRTITSVSFYTKDHQKCAHPGDTNKYILPPGPVYTYQLVNINHSFWFGWLLPHSTS